MVTQVFVGIYLHYRFLTGFPRDLVCLFLVLQCEPNFVSDSDLAKTINKISILLSKFKLQQIIVIDVILPVD